MVDRLNKGDPWSELRRQVNNLNAQVDGLRAALGAAGIMVSRVGNGMAFSVSRGQTAAHAPSIPSMMRTIKVLEDHDGGGKYEASEYVGRLETDTTSNLTMPEGLQSVVGNSGANCVAINPDEDGLATHRTEANAYTLGFLVGYSDEEGSTGQPVYLIPWARPRTASGDTIGTTSEGSETADGKSWKRDEVAAGDQYGDGPITVNLISRVVYNEAGDKKLYAYARSLKFDASGRLFEVSAETRYIVDTPVDCSA
jgi:hypothetical protein